MKITRLQAENFKRIIALDVRPDGSIVNIAGKNAQGKSSTLDAIEAALAGKNAMPSMPVRQGEQEGAIRLELDDGALIVRRIFNNNGEDQLIVEEEGKHGRHRLSGPQQILNGLYSNIAFDPLEFVRLKPDKQAHHLRGLTGLNFTELDKDRKSIYDERRDVNRDCAQWEGQLKALSHVPNVPAELPDIEALERQIAEASATNGMIEQRKVRRAAAKEEKAQLELRIQDMKQALAAAEDHLRHITEQLANAEPLPEPIDVAAVQEELRQASFIQRENDLVAQKIAIKARVDKLSALSSELTGKLEAIDKQKADEIAAAKMPIEGLSIGDDEVLFEGIPLEQASMAQKIRVSASIGMALNPELRVMLVREAALIDDEGLAVLAHMAQTNDFQFWLETIDPKAESGIIIEAGAVQGADTPEPIEKPKRREKKEEPVQGETQILEQDAVAGESATEQGGEAHAAGAPAPEGEAGEASALAAPAEPDLIVTDEAGPAPKSLFERMSDISKAQQAPQEPQDAQEPAQGPETPVEAEIAPSEPEIEREEPSEPQPEQNPDVNDVSNDDMQPQRRPVESLFD